MAATAPPFGYAGARIAGRERITSLRLSTFAQQPGIPQRDGWLTAISAETAPAPTGYLPTTANLTPVDVPDRDTICALVERCLRQDADAMVALMAQFESLVLGLCLRMLGHRQDAEDATQETFVRVFKSLARWDATRDFKPWLLAIAGNRCRSMLAARKTRAKPAELVEDVADRAPDHQAAKYLAEEMNRALGQVRDEYRQAFLLFHEQELSYGDIGAAMDVPVGTVKTWIHRARKELVEHLRQRGVLEGSLKGES